MDVAGIQALFQPSFNLTLRIGHPALSFGSEMAPSWLYEVKSKENSGFVVDEESHFQFSMSGRVFKRGDGYTP
jgi:hypothetical protein